MIKILKEIESNLSSLIQDAINNNTLKTKYIDYHDPYVSRIYFPYGKYRIFLHKIHPCKSSTDALYHPHPWVSAVKICKGSYEMGIGHSSTTDIPETDCTVILSEGSYYEMLNPDAWHYVFSDKDVVYTLMVTGEPNGRKMPIEPTKEFNELPKEEIDDILKNILND